MMVLPGTVIWKQRVWHDSHLFRKFRVLNVKFAIRIIFNQLVSMKWKFCRDQIMICFPLLLSRCRWPEPICLQLALVQEMDHCTSPRRTDCQMDAEEAICLSPSPDEETLSPQAWCWSGQLSQALQLFLLPILPLSYPPGYVCWCGDWQGIVSY